MIVIILLGILCLYLFNRYKNKLEIRDYDEWRPLKLPVGIWLIIIVAALTPLINVVGLFLFELFTILESNDKYSDIRFKEGESCILAKIIELMKKEF